MLADSQVHRFLILHKELDPDDDELTRTRKVRRGFVAEKYGVLIDALYSGKTSQFIETEVKFEDGRTSKVSADAHQRRSPSRPRRRHFRHDEESSMRIGRKDRRRHPRPAEHLAASFGGVKALTEHFLRRARARECAPSSAPTAPARVPCSTSSTACITRRKARSFSAATSARHGYPRGGHPGHRPHLPEHRPVQGHERCSTTS
jgi:hypothetical protein